MVQHADRRWASVASLARLLPARSHALRPGGASAGVDVRRLSPACERCQIARGASPSVVSAGVGFEWGSRKLHAFPLLPVVRVLLEVVRLTRST